MSTSHGGAKYATLASRLHVMPLTSGWSHYIAIILHQSLQRRRRAHVGGDKTIVVRLRESMYRSHTQVTVTITTMPSPSRRICQVIHVRREHLEEYKEVIDPLRCI